jgi:hypothetical protein
MPERWIENNMLPGAVTVGFDGSFGELGGCDGRGRELIIDAIFAEALFGFERLKVWQGAGEHEMPMVLGALHQVLQMCDALDR